MTKYERIKGDLICHSLRCETTTGSGEDEVYLLVVVGRSDTGKVSIHTVPEAQGHHFDLNDGRDDDNREAKNLKLWSGRLPEIGGKVLVEVLVMDKDLDFFSSLPKWIVDAIDFAAQVLDGEDQDDAEKIARGVGETVKFLKERSKQELIGSFSAKIYQNSANGRIYVTWIKGQHAVPMKLPSNDPVRKAKDAKYPYWFDLKGGGRRGRAHYRAKLFVRQTTETIVKTDSLQEMKA